MDKEFPKPKTEKRVIDIIAQELWLDENEVKLKSNITQDLGADDLDMIELIMALEKEFDITIPDKEVEKMTTVGDVIKYINENWPPTAPPKNMGGGGCPNK